MYKTRTICRACDWGRPNTPSGIKSEQAREDLIEVFDFGLQPMANDFVKPEEEHKGYAPLKVMFCPRCTLAQLSVVVDPEILYANYPYVTSRSQTMMNHFADLWRLIARQGGGESVVEIGSNDGWFLKYCQEKGATSVLGIDPAENLKPADNTGILSIVSVFDQAAANMARRAVPDVNVIVARHVFAHVDDWKTFLKSLDILANKDTLIVIECPYVGDLLNGGQFDTIYHEHLSYISIQAVAYWLKDSPFHLHKIQRFPIHGGAVVMLLRRNDCGIEPDRSVPEFMLAEDVGLKHWRDFSYHSKLKVDSLLHLVRRRVSDGQTVCGFGASAKSTVWVNAGGFTKYELKFIADSTRQKWGTFSPGSDIPIVDEGALLRDEPAYAVCFAWNFLPEILSSQSLYMKKGGKFIVPIPEIKIVGANGNEQV